MTRCLVAVFLALALGITGCSETEGTGGIGGEGGFAGTGGGLVPCQPATDRCSNGPIESHEACCEQRVPDQAEACDGTESTKNPATCTRTENPITYRLTLMEVEGDCHVGYDLDGCDGESCVPTGLTPAEGMNGVDNALGGLAPIAAGVGGDVGRLNKAFSGALCGLTPGLACFGGDDDGQPCRASADCRGADAFCLWVDCRVETPPANIRFVVDPNPSEGCANVTVLTDGESSAQILNLSDGGCLSGRLGTIPVPLPAPLVGENASFENTVVRMTVSPAGFSHGRLGATVDADTLVGILDEILPVAATATPVFDINASTPPTLDASTPCNGLSATLRIGGVAE